MVENAGVGGAANWEQLCRDAGLEWSEKDLREAGVPKEDVHRLIKVHKALEEYLILADAAYTLHLYEFEDLHNLSKDRYNDVAAFLHVTKDDLKSCGLPNTRVAPLLQHQEQAIAAYKQQQQGFHPAGQQGACKRQRVDVKVKPSDLKSAKTAEVYFPQPLLSEANLLQQSKACFITGRPVTVPVQGALSAALLAPEFGIVLDAFWRGFGNPTPYYFHAALELLTQMRKVYSREDLRQQAYLEWHNKTYPGLRIALPDRSNSTSSPSSAEPSSDGRCGVPVTRDESKCVIVLEAKNELGASGDPHLQGLRYYQIHIGDGKFTSKYLEATGHPAFLIGLSGPYLDISAMYRTDSNQVVLEPLTPMMALTVDPLRQPAAVATLARVLMAFGVAGWGLVERVLRLPSDPSPCRSDDTWAQACKEQRELDAKTWAAGYEGDCVKKWFDRVQRAADDLEPLCIQRSMTGGLVPYPLWGRDYGNMKLLEPNRTRLVYAATTRQGDGGEEAVVIKVTSERYPREVHQAWSDAQVAPLLHLCDFMPGGCSVVVMERLGDDWMTLAAVEAEERIRAKEAAKGVLARAHAIPVSMGSKTGTAVHGDARGPNVMVRHIEDKWEVRFVDLDWAGLDGEARYQFPLNSRIDWHPDAKQGAIIAQEHDRFMLGR